MHMQFSLQAARLRASVPALALVLIAPFVPSALAKENAAEQFHREAQELSKAQSYPAAEAAYRRAIAMDPANGWYMADFGQFYLWRLKRNAEALACFEKALALGFNREWVLRQKGIALVRLERHREAEGDFRAAFLRLSARVTESKDSEGTIRELSSVTGSLAALLNRQNRFQEAVAVLNQASRSSPAVHGAGFASAGLNAATRLKIGRSKNENTLGKESRTLDLGGLQPPLHQLFAQEYAATDTFVFIWNGQGVATAANGRSATYDLGESRSIRRGFVHISAERLRLPSGPVLFLHEMAHTVERSIGQNLAIDGLARTRRPQFPLCRDYGEIAFFDCHFRSTLPAFFLRRELFPQLPPFRNLNFRLRFPQPMKAADRG